jgi:hypothetical protein
VQYETTETKTPVGLGRREFLRDVTVATIGAGICVAGGFAAVDYQKQLDQNITALELARFREYEHDRENLKQWLDGCDKGSLKQLLRLQIGLLDGSDLRSLEACAKHLADGQTGPARADVHSIFEVTSSDGTAGRSHKRNQGCVEQI